MGNIKVAFKADENGMRLMALFLATLRDQLYPKDEREITARVVANGEYEVKL